MKTLELFPESGELTSFAGDSPVSHFRSPGSNWARKMTAISGQQCLKQSNASDPLGSLEKMLLDSSDWGSTRCYLTWKAQDTRQGRLLFRLSPSMPRTAGTDFGSWPTPRSCSAMAAPFTENTPKAKFPNLETVVAQRMWLTPNVMDSLPPRSEEALRKQYSKNRTGRTSHSTLREQVVYPEPNKMWPTPVARMWKDCGAPSEYKRNEVPLAAQVGGTLNPTWVEWLMGYPSGWTDLDA